MAFSIFRAVDRYRELEHDGWARLIGYGRRWAVETAYSAFKRLFVEHSLARSFENIARGLTAKVALCNAIVNV
jgi:hypothetical protein